MHSDERGGSPAKFIMFEGERNDEVGKFVFSRDYNKLKTDFKDLSEAACECEEIRVEQEKEIDELEAQLAIAVGFVKDRAFCDYHCVAHFSNHHKDCKLIKADKVLNQLKTKPHAVVEVGVRNNILMSTDPNDKINWVGDQGKTGVNGQYKGTLIVWEN